MTSAYGSPFLAVIRR